MISGIVRTVGYIASFGSAVGAELIAGTILDCVTIETSSKVVKGIVKLGKYGIATVVGITVGEAIQQQVEEVGAIIEVAADKIKDKKDSKKFGKKVKTVEFEEGVA